MQAPKEFTLVLNGKSHQFKARTFAKVSKKAGQLMKNGVFYSKIEKEYPDESATAFILACNFKEFKVTANNAFDLLELAQDWRIGNLEKFVRSYCSSKGLIAPEELDNGDYLEVFLDKLEKHELTKDDYFKVAQKLDNYLDDDRLLALHPLPLFRILLAAEYTQINDQKLAAFILKLIKDKPYAAVPLLLRINYDMLSQDQEKIIFDMPEVHDQNFSFFISNSNSAIRNKIKRVLQQVEQSINKSLEQVEEDAQKHRAENNKQLDEDFKIQLEELKHAADAQRKQIEELKKYRERTLKRRKDIDDDFQDREEETDQQIDHVKEMMEKRKEQTDILRRQIDNEIGKQVGRVRERVVDQLNDVRNDDQDRRDAGNEPRQELFDGLKRNVDRMKKNCQMLSSAVKGTVDEKNYIKATLAAKMVKDFMRFDNFIRKTEKRFQIFDDKSILHLSSAEVQKADKDLNDVERRIDKLCPIRHTIAK